MVISAKNEIFAYDFESDMDWNVFNRNRCCIKQIDILA